MVYIEQIISELKNLIILFFVEKKSIPVNTNRFKLSIVSSELNHVTSTKFLGVIIDENLTWKAHVDWVSAKVHKSLGIIRKVSHQMNTKCLLTLYYSLIYPYLSYCNLVWASTFPSTLKNIFILQKRFVRIATHSTQRTPSASLFVKLNILDIYHLNIYQICIFMHRIQFNPGIIPEHFRFYFKTNAEVHNYNTRQSKELHLPKSVTSRAQFLLRYRGCKLWSQHSHLVNGTSLISFKKKNIKSLFKCP